MQDGNLCIVDLGKIEKQSRLFPLQWRTIEPTTGAVMSSQPILKLVSANMLPVVHCGAAQAVGMRDAHHIVFLDAETLQQLAEHSVCLQTLTPAEGQSASKACFGQSMA